MIYSPNSQLTTVVCYLNHYIARCVSQSVTVLSPSIAFRGSNNNNDDDDPVTAAYNSSSGGGIKVFVDGRSVFDYLDIGTDYNNQGEPLRIQNMVNRPPHPTTTTTTT